MYMTKLLTSVSVITALLYSTAFAADSFKVGMEDGKQRVEFSLHGKTGCVLVDGKVFCAPATKRAPIRLTSFTSD